MWLVIHGCQNLAAQYEIVLSGKSSCLTGVCLRIAGMEPLEEAT